MKLDILAFGAHPDDVELGCGGTLAKHAKLGYKIGIVDFTPSQLSTRGTIENRAEEAKNAADILGCSSRHNMNFDDGFFENKNENLLEIVKFIREYQPEIIFANAPDDRHPDHGRASVMVKQANFLAGLQKIETADLKPWRAKSLYYYIQFKHIEPDFLVDIEEVVDIKRASLQAYKSQFFDPSSTEPATLIASEKFMNLIEGRHAVFGAMGMASCAEGFLTEYKLVANNLFDLAHN